MLNSNLLIAFEHEKLQWREHSSLELLASLV